MCTRCIAAQLPIPEVPVYVYNPKAKCYVIPGAWWTWINLWFGPSSGKRDEVPLA